jgi:serine/threonine-protein kinase
MHSLLQETPTEATNALRYFEAAVRIDPEFARAHAFLAITYALMNGIELGPPIAWMPAARAAAEKAVALDEPLPEAHLAMGLITEIYDWDWAGAERHYRRALELNPRSAFVLDVYHLFLDVMGRGDEAAQILRRLEEVDPLAATVQSAIHALGRGEHDRALEEIQQTRGWMPGWAEGYRHIGWIEEQRGRMVEAGESYLTYFAMTGATDGELVALSGAVKAGGLSGMFRLRLVQMESSSRYFNWEMRAEYHARLGDKEGALRCLEQSCENREKFAYQIRGENYAFLREEPRYQALLRRMGLK